jgi:hypothetical protein
VALNNLFSLVGRNNLHFSLVLQGDDTSHNFSWGLFLRGSWLAGDSCEFYSMSLMVRPVMILGMVGKGKSGLQATARHHQMVESQCWVLKALKVTSEKDLKESVLASSLHSQPFCSLLQQTDKWYCNCLWYSVTHRAVWKDSTAFSAVCHRCARTCAHYFPTLPSVILCWWFETGYNGSIYIMDIGKCYKPFPLIPELAVKHLPGYLLYTLND